MKLLVIALSLTLSLTARAAEPVAPAPVVHFDMAVKDIRLAKEFYSKLFGWTFSPSAFPEVVYVDAGPGGIRGNLRKEDFTVSGPQGTIVYVLVNDLRAKLELAQSLGSSVVVPPIVVSPPESGTIAVITDLNGNLVGMYSK